MTLLDDQFLEMRARCLSLAADLDRLERSPGGRQALETDERLATLRQAFALMFDGNARRAERVQLLFSDHGDGQDGGPTCV